MVLEMQQAGEWATGVATESQIAEAGTDFAQGKISEGLVAVFFSVSAVRGMADPEDALNQVTALNDYRNELAGGGSWQHLSAADRDSLTTLFGGEPTKDQVTTMSDTLATKLRAATNEAGRTAVEDYVKDTFFKEPAAGKLAGSVS